jgi:hypothetical protein
MKFKEMSKYSVIFIKNKEYCMNLHEECLLKYLLNPLDLCNSTELLKLNNAMIEKSLSNIKAPKVKCSATRM